MSRLIGMPAVVDFDRLDWARDLVIGVPTIVVHSSGDEEIPFELTRSFVLAHPLVALVETAVAPHGWEANVDPNLFRSALASWLEGSVSTVPRRS